jgi:hypothetical protein
MEEVTLGSTLRSGVVGHAATVQTVLMRKVTAASRANQRRCLGLAHQPVAPRPGGCPRSSPPRDTARLTASWMLFAELPEA